MEKLQLCVDYIINNRAEANNETLYQVLSEINLTDINEEELEKIICKIHQLCKKKKLCKYYVYLCCMANDNCRILEKFVEYDKANANLNVISKVEIFEYVVFKRKHWFLKVLENYENLGKEYFNEILYQKILIAKLIELTNATDIDIEKIEYILNLMFTSEDKFVEFYKKEVKKVLGVLTFMEKLDVTKNKIHEIFHFIICNSLLSSLSKYIRLEKREYWCDIESKLRRDEDTTELDIFFSFTVIYTIMNVVISTNGIIIVRDDIERAKQNFFKITNTKLQIEVIKILFIVIFLRKEHLKSCSTEENLKENQAHLNDCRSVSIIMEFLKNIFEIIKIQKRFNKESAEYKTFMKFNKYLVDAIWRYELISHVKASKLTTSPHRLISYMLAPPESLIYMCLKSKDFERAQQVIQVSL